MEKYFNEPNIHCPHCDYEFEESYEHVDLDNSAEECQEVKCLRCDRKFIVSIDKSVSYTSKCLEDEHEYKDSPSETHPDKQECVACGDMNFKRFDK